VFSGKFSISKKSLIPSPLGVMTLGNSNGRFGDNESEQSTNVMVWVRVSEKHSKSTEAVIWYVPISENKWLGFKEDELLFAPEFGSPKFQFT
jgi:hypothetical protein